MQGLNENLTTPVEEKSKIRKKHGRLWQITKWTVISISSLFATGLAVGGGVVYYYSRPAEADGRDSQSMPRSEEELLAILREEFGYNVQITEKFACEDYEVEEMELGLKEMADRVLVKIIIEVIRYQIEPEETKENIKKHAKKAEEYVAKYQLSEDQMAVTDPEKIDCNDYAFRACQRLKRHGITMYLLNICPRDPSMRLDEQSHQVAFCKLREKEYLICDNDSLIYWHGTLDQFATQYNIDNPDAVIMGKLPLVDSSEYVEPKHNNPFSKVLLQVLNVTDEEEIESMNLPQRPVRGELADIL